MVKNLTVGKPLPLLFYYALPMLMGNFFQQLYNMVDTMVVGKFVGDDAVAAVGASFPIVFLAVASASGLSMGTNVVVSQLFGAGRTRELKSTVSTALIALTGLGLIITVFGIFLGEPLLRLLGTDADIIGDSITYLSIYFGGAVFLFLYNTLNGIYNALGDSKTPLYFLMTSSLLNIALDLLFVIRFGMGVAGVAWATLIAQGVCAVLSFVVMFRRLRSMPDEAHAATGKLPLFQLIAVKRIARIGLPSMFQQSLVSLSMLFLQNLVNTYGKQFVAGYTAGTKIDSLCLLPNQNFANAMSSFAAQNIGAGKPERVREGYRACILMSVIFSAMLTIIVYLFGTNLVSLFLEKGETGSAMGYGIEFMSIVSLFYVLMALMFVTNGLMRGAGDMASFLTSSISNMIVRVGSAYLLNSLLAPEFAHFSIAFSIPAGWAVGTIVSQLRYRSGAWKNKAFIAAKDQTSPA